MFKLLDFNIYVCFRFVTFSDILGDLITHTVVYIDVLIWSTGLIYWSCSMSINLTIYLIIVSFNCFLCVIFPPEFN